MHSFHSSESVDQLLFPRLNELCGPSEVSYSCAVVLGDLSKCLTPLLDHHILLREIAKIIL